MTISPNLSATRRFVVTLGLSLFGLGTATAQNFVNFEARQTTPLRLSPDGTRLFAVNTPDNRVSVFDVSRPQNPVLIAEVPVGLEPVSVNPRTADEAWVVNEVSDSVSVISVSRGIVVDTLRAKDEPADVVFAGGRAFVTLARLNQIAVFDVASHTLVTNLAVRGECPRALAVNPAGTRVYAAFALSGNRTTVIPPEKAPPQSTAGMRPGLPPPPQVSLIVDAADPTWSTGPIPVIQYSMPDNDVVEIDVASLSVTRYFTRVGTVNLGLAVNPADGSLWVANTEAGNLGHFEPALRGHFVSNRLSRIAVPSGTVSTFDLNPGFATTNFPRQPELTNALAQPTAVVFAPDGRSGWVAAFGTDRIARFDTDGVIRHRVELTPSAAGSVADPRNKRGPRGLALKAGEALYVLNRLANSLTVIDPAAEIVVRELPVGAFDPTPVAIRAGRGFLYDAKLSGNGTVSCASCHVDAENDLLAWDLGDPTGVLETNRTFLPQFNLTIASTFHPMKGPMTTQTLRGLSGMDPLHWRGDRTNLLHFNGAFASLLGGSMLSAADIQAFRAYVDTIVFAPNPNQNLDRTLPESFAGANPRAGFTNYTVDQYVTGLTCNTCHALPTGTARFIIPGVALQESQDFKVPQLRSVYQKLNFNRSAGAASTAGFGVVHDGQDPSLVAFLSRPVFGTFATNETIKRNLNAFVQCFDTGTAPAVGYARTIVATNVLTPAVSNDWRLLETQAALVTNLDLVAKGSWNGVPHGWVYVPASATYRPDSTNLANLTRAQLQAGIVAGDAITVLGVPPGSGPRIGIDRDSNGIRDADEPRPSVRIAPTPGAVVVSWPTNPANYVLETTRATGGWQWAPETSPRTTAGAELRVTNRVEDASRLYRLRRF